MKRIFGRERSLRQLRTESADHKMNRKVFEAASSDAGARLSEGVGDKRKREGLNSNSMRVASWPIGVRLETVIVINSVAGAVALGYFKIVSWSYRNISVLFGNN